MLIQIIKSNRGVNNAVHNGYCYNQKQVTSSCIHWRRTKYYSIKCPAVLKTNQNVVISFNDSHTHESDPSECKAKDFVNQIKQKSESLTPTVAIASEILVICLICEQSPTLDENNELFCCIDLLLLI